MKRLLRRWRLPAGSGRQYGCGPRYGVPGRAKRLLVSQLFQPFNLQAGDEAGWEGRAGEPACRSQKLMLQGGLVYPSGPGCYYYLPPAVRAVEKLVKVVDGEMQAVGGAEAEHAQPELGGAVACQRPLGRDGAGALPAGGPARQGLLPGPHARGGRDGAGGRSEQPVLQAAPAAPLPGDQEVSGRAQAPLRLAAQPGVLHEGHVHLRRLRRGGSADLRPGVRRLPQPLRPPGPSLRQSAGGHGQHRRHRVPRVPAPGGRRRGQAAAVPRRTFRGQRGNAKRGANVLPHVRGKTHRDQRDRSGAHVLSGHQVLLRLQRRLLLLQEQTPAGRNGLLRAGHHSHPGGLHRGALHGGQHPLAEPHRALPALLHSPQERQQGGGGGSHAAGAGVRRPRRSAAPPRRRLGPG
uniref:Uncharacterized protein n=1 Tax=Aquila chrysaetos chrysaetos TaxID=223781 RepID=A0A663FIA3_AQUCH